MEQQKDGVFDFHTEKAGKYGVAEANYVPEITIDNHSVKVDLQVDVKSKDPIDKEALAKKMAKAILDLGKPGSLAISVKKAKVKSARLTI